MTSLDQLLRQLFSTPVCPNCATLYDDEQFDEVDECARCSHCGTTYQVPDGFRPAHPEDALEYAVEDASASTSLAQFRKDADRLAAAAIQETKGASYELYAQRFTEACEPYIDALDPALRHQAISIANYHGFIEDAAGLEAGFGPGRCSFTGIEEDYCHCGRHP